MNLLEIHEFFMVQSRIMKNIFITMKIPMTGIDILKNNGFNIDQNESDDVLSREDFMNSLSQKEYDAVLCTLRDKIDSAVFDKSPSTKVFSNYAVGYDNVDIEEAKKRGITITNTPGVLTEAVAKHTASLLLSISSRVVEGDKFVRAGKFTGWEPLLLLGTELKGKKLGIVGAGRIGVRVAQMMRKGFDMEIIYYDIGRNENIESLTDAKFYQSLSDLVSESDFVSIHTPLNENTRNLFNEDLLSKMKKEAYLINTSRGPVVDEDALVKILKQEKIRGAALDVFENEPLLAKGLKDLDNVVLTPHTASATYETRAEMSRIAAENIINVLEGRDPISRVV